MIHHQQQHTSVVPKVGLANFMNIINWTETLKGKEETQRKISTFYDYQVNDQQQKNERFYLGQRKS